MSWSYTGDPTSSAKDETRFLIGDTDSTDQLLQDGEIAYLLAKYNNAPLSAAIRACETIMAKFARMADETVGRVRIAFNQKYKAYAEMKTELRARIAIEGTIPYAGGISRTDVETVEKDEDRVKPEFSKHMLENQQMAPWTTDEKLMRGDQGQDD